MIDDRFSLPAFSELGLNSEEAQDRATELEAAVLEELHPAVLEAFEKVVARLNGMGHRLSAEYDALPGDISFQDLSNGECKLRLSLDLVVSAGYCHMVRVP
jgi:hypothetical protein